MKKSLLILLLAGILSACGSKHDPIVKKSSQIIKTERVQKMNLQMKINGQKLEVAWENNAAVTELTNLAKQGVTIKSHLFGGFEQTGALPQALRSNDHQQTAHPGDIMLYNSDTFVVFFGKNDWAYTKLGHVTNLSSQELKHLLNRKQVTIELAVSESK